MASKKHRPEEALAKLRQVDVLVSQGQSVAEAIRAVGVTEVIPTRIFADLFQPHPARSGRGGATSQQQCGPV